MRKFSKVISSFFVVLLTVGVGIALSEVTKDFSIPNIDKANVLEFEVVNDRLMCAAKGGKEVNIIVRLKDEGENQINLSNSGEDMIEATSFAQHFNDEFGKICSAYGKTGVQEIVKEWENQSSLFLALKYETAKEILKNATANEKGNDIEKFAAKYDYIYSHYADILEIAGGNFIQRKVTSVDQVYFASSKGDSNVIIAAIIAVSVISVSALGILLFIKKRKYN